MGDTQARLSRVRDELAELQSVEEGERAAALLLAFEAVERLVAGDLVEERADMLSRVASLVQESADRDACVGVHKRFEPDEEGRWVLAVEWSARRGQLFCLRSTPVPALDPASSWRSVPERVPLPTSVEECVAELRTLGVSENLPSWSHAMEA